MSANPAWAEEPEPDLVEVLMGQLATKTAEVAVLTLALKEPNLAQSLESLKWELARQRVRTKIAEDRAKLGQDVRERAAFADIHERRANDLSRELDQVRAELRDVKKLLDVRELDVARLAKGYAESRAKEERLHEFVDQMRASFTEEPRRHHGRRAGTAVKR